jgi:hypothetical protein
VIVDIPAGKSAARFESGRIDHGPGPSRTTATISATRRRHRERHRRRIFTSGDEALIRQLRPERLELERAGGTQFRITVQVPRGMDVDFEDEYGELHFEGELETSTPIFARRDSHERAARRAQLNPRPSVSAVHRLRYRSEDHEGVFPGSTHFVSERPRAHQPAHDRRRAARHTPVIPLCPLCLFCPLCHCG